MTAWACRNWPLCMLMEVYVGYVDVMLHYRCHPLVTWNLFRAQGVLHSPARKKNRIMILANTANGPLGREESAQKCLRNFASRVQTISSIFKYKPRLMSHP